MRRLASSLGFGGHGWLIVVSMPFQAPSVTGHISTFNGKALIRGEQMKGAGMGRGQHIGGIGDDGSSELPSTDSNDHGMLSGSPIGALGKDPQEPPADLGSFERPPTVFQSQSLAGAPPARKWPRSKAGLMFKSFLVAKRGSPSNSKQSAVKFGPGSELAWGDENIAQFFGPYMEKIGTPLGRGPYNIKLVIGNELVKRQHSTVYATRVVSSAAQHFPRIVVEALDIGNKRGTLNTEARFWFMSEFKEAMKDPKHPKLQGWLEPFGFVSTDFLIEQGPFSSSLGHLKRAIAMYPDKRTPLRLVYAMMHDLLLSLTKMHQKGIAHRHIGFGALVFVKSVTGSLSLVLTAFGSACVFRNTGTLVHATLADDYPCDYSIGESDYMPPEMPHEAELAESKRDMVDKQDIWAAGILFLLVLDPMWAGNIFEGEGENLAPGIRDRLYEDPELLIDELLIQRTDLKTSPRGKHLVGVLRTMLRLDPAERPRADKCFMMLRRGLPKIPWSFKNVELPAAAA